MSVEVELVDRVQILLERANEEAKRLRWRKKFSVEPKNLLHEGDTVCADFHHQVMVRAVGYGLSFEGFHAGRLVFRK